MRRLLDEMLIEALLVESLARFLAAGREYPFVDMRELKARAAGSGLPEEAVVLHNHGLVLLADCTLPAESKKHIRFRDKCRVIKENLAGTRLFDELLLDQFELPWTVPGRRGFEALARLLMRLDYGLLVQQDPRAPRQQRLALTHFRVRIDWPVEQAAESMGLDLGYLKRHLYEQSEQRAELIEAKLYERYGFHHTVGGRRTAAILAAQYLHQLAASGGGFDWCVYTGSAEARTLTVLHADRIRRYALIRLSKQEIDALEEQRPVRPTHLIHHDTDQGGVAVLEVTYGLTDHARPEKKWRNPENLASLSFLKVEEQRLVPRRDVEAEPAPVSVVYRSQE